MVTDMYAKRIDSEIWTAGKDKKRLLIIVTRNSQDINYVIINTLTARCVSVLYYPDGYISVTDELPRYAGFDEKEAKTQIVKSLNRR